MLYEVITPCTDRGRDDGLLSFCDQVYLGQEAQDAGRTQAADHADERAGGYQGPGHAEEVPDSYNFV